MAENANPRVLARARPTTLPRLLRTSRTRFQAILPLLKVRAAEARGQSVMMLSGFGRELKRFDEKVAHVADLAGASSRTMYRWLCRFEREGLTGLRDRPRRDKGAFRAFHKRGAALAFVIVEALNGHTAACIHRQLCNLWPRLYRGSQPPSYSSVAGLLASLAPLLKSAKTRKRPRQVRP